MKVLITTLLVLVFSMTAHGKDLLPFKTKAKTGEVQLQSESALTYIDNEALYLNPDQNGKHQTLFFYKAQELLSVPYLEVRYRGTKGTFNVEIGKGKEWISLKTVKAEGDKWVREKYELGDNVSAFALGKGIVVVRITAIETAESLELDYISITADEQQKSFQASR